MILNEIKSNEIKTKLKEPNFGTELYAVVCLYGLYDGHNKNDNNYDMYLIFMHFHHPLFSGMHTHI